MRKSFIRILEAIAWLCIACVVSSAVSAQETIPVLHYAPPPGTTHGGSGPPDDYVFSQFNGQVEFYPFRKVQGNIRAAFEQTMFSGWIDLQYREQSLAAPPVFQQVLVKGADFAEAATFEENPGFVSKPHMRTLIVSGNYAALVDYSSNSRQTYEMAFPALQAMANSLQVVTAKAPPPLASAAGKAVAGLYQGMKQKLMTSMENVTGMSYTTNALHFYLFSANGRVYRHYDALDVPGGNVNAFDFDGAAQSDPENSGVYTANGGKLIITMGGPTPKTIATSVPKNGAVTIEGVTYTKKF